jgi:hypothetical protein
MTPEELAAKCMSGPDLSRNLAYAPHDIKERIADAIRAAVEEEREAIAAMLMERCEAKIRAYRITNDEALGVSAATLEGAVAAIRSRTS